MTLWIISLAIVRIARSGSAWPSGDLRDPADEGLDPLVFPELCDHVGNDVWRDVLEALGQQAHQRVVTTGLILQNRPPLAFRVAALVPGSSTKRRMRLAA